LSGILPKPYVDYVAFLYGGRRFGEFTVYRNAPRVASVVSDGAALYYARYLQKFVKSHSGGSSPAVSAAAADLKAVETKQPFLLRGASML
jgi:hypothetical protein